MRYLTLSEVRNKAGESVEIEGGDSDPRLTSDSAIGVTSRSELNLSSQVEGSFIVKPHYVRQMCSIDTKPRLLLIYVTTQLSYIPDSSNGRTTPSDGEN